MAKIIYLITIIIFCTVNYGCSNIDEDNEKLASEYKSWMINYHRSGDPRDVLPRLRSYLTTSLFKSEENRLSQIYFYSTILRNNPDIINQNFNTVILSLGQDKDSSDIKKFLIQLLWFTNTVKSRALITIAQSKIENIDNERDLIIKLKKTSPPWPPNQKNEEITSLEPLWAIYFATGDRKLIRKIASFLDFVENKDINKIILAASAGNSLASHAIEDPIVCEVIHEILQKDITTKLKVILEDILPKKT
jgi:hypothetical protein